MLLHIRESKVEKSSTCLFQSLQNHTNVSAQFCGCLRNVLEGGGQRAKMNGANSVRSAVRPP